MLMPTHLRTDVAVDVVDVVDVVAAAVGSLICWRRWMGWSMSPERIRNPDPFRT